MNLLPFRLTFEKQASGATAVSVTRNGNFFWPFISEPFTGAWQRNQELSVSDITAYHAVYACITLIASDMGKMRPKLVQLDDDGIWSETRSPAFSPVLRKPNHYQNHIQFKEWWAMSKLLRGNTYALKERDRRGVVVALHLLDPTRVTVLVAPNGEVYYDLKTDNLAGVEQALTGESAVPASEIIHDRMNCLFHPLVGTSPIYACGAAASIGLTVEHQSRKFFENGSKVSGQLLIPTSIPQEKADELRERWQQKFTGENSGHIAVLSGGMKFEPLQMTAVDAQLIEHLRLSAEAVCSAFHVPAWKVGVKDATYASAEAANTVYYSDCLQSHIEQFELCMDEGLGIGEGVSIDGNTYGVELDLDNLIRMDSASQVTTLAAAVGGSLMKVDDARKKMNLPPVEGGDTIYMQQQNYSLAALAERDRNSPLLQPAAPALQPNAGNAADDDQEARALRIERAATFDFGLAFETLKKELAPT
jgi:HK97 family phage portal protein